MKSHKCIANGFILGLSISLTSLSQANTNDPTDSPMWDYLKTKYIPNQSYQFDQRIIVQTPLFAEDATQVPITIDATAIPNVEKILVLADISPFQKVLEFTPGKFTPQLSFSMKVQQATAVRAMVLTKSGVWHVGSGLIDASGGGCSAPSIGLADPAWQDYLGEIRARWFSANHLTGEKQRLKFHIIHPQDTGLADSIPAFFIEQLHIDNQQGNTIARLQLFEPVSENPTMTLEKLGTTETLTLHFRDNNGNEFTRQVKP